MEGENSTQHCTTHTCLNEVGGMSSHKHPFPTSWKSPTIDKYDNGGNPDEHVDAYITQVNLYRVDDALFCRVFPTSLKGVVLNWFTRIPFVQLIALTR